MSASNQLGGLLFHDNGPTSPDPGEVRGRVVDMFKSIYGQDLDVSPSTPQGQIIDGIAAIVSDKNSQTLFLANQWNPELAEGKWQDDVCKIYFISRQPARPTSALCDCAGARMTLIPAGALAQDRSGILYRCVADTVIPDSGLAENVPFACVEPGPVPCPAGAIGRIYRRVPGWDTVTNPEDGVPGALEETRMALEKRRALSVAKNAHGNVSAIWGSLANLEGVVSVQMAENATGAPAIMRGVLVPGHSVFISVSGGADRDIAQTIYERKDAGCGCAGNREAVIFVPTRDAVAMREKTIAFNRPTAIPCKAQVTIRKDERLTVGNIVELIKRCVVDAWNGLGNVPRVEIGETVYASKFYCPLGSIDAIYELVSVKVDRPLPWLSANAFFDADSAALAIGIAGETPTAGEYGFFAAEEDGLAIRGTASADDADALFAAAGQAVAIGDAVPAYRYDGWSDSFETSLDEFPVICEEDVEVVVA